LIHSIPNSRQRDVLAYTPDNLGKWRRVTVVSLVPVLSKEGKPYSNVGRSNACRRIAELLGAGVSNTPTKPAMSWIAVQPWMPQQ